MGESRCMGESKELQETDGDTWLWKKLRHVNMGRDQVDLHRNVKTSENLPLLLFGKFKEHGEWVLRAEKLQEVQTGKRVEKKWHLEGANIQLASESKRALITSCMFVSMDMCMYIQKRCIKHKVLYFICIFSYFEVSSMKHLCSSSINLPSSLF